MVLPGLGAAGGEIRLVGRLVTMLDFSGQEDMAKLVHGLAIQKFVGEIKLKPAPEVQNRLF